MITGDLNIYAEPVLNYQFPLNFGNTYEFANTLVNNYVSTVAAFGLDHVPGQCNIYTQTTQEVSGAGTLLLPHPSGTVAVEVLLLKEEKTITDSVFLGGQPAPQALLDAFGLVQGGITQETIYNFVAKGLPRSAFSFNKQNGESTFAVMADAVQNVGVAVNDLPTFERTDYTQLAGTTITHQQVESTSVTILSTGILAQVWDYSDIPPSSMA